MQDTAGDRDMAVGVGGPDPREHLVKRVGVGEDVMGGLPVGVFVGVAKARHSYRRGVSDLLAKVRRSGPLANCRLDRVNDPSRIIAKEVLGESRVVRPAVRSPADDEESRSSLTNRHTAR